MSRGAMWLSWEWIPINWDGREEEEKLEGSRGVESPKQLFLHPSPIRKALWLETMKGFPLQQPTVGGGFPSAGTGC